MVNNKNSVALTDPYYWEADDTVNIGAVTDFNNEAGGVPVEFGAPSTCGDMIVGEEELKYELAGRVAVAMAVEYVSRVHQFDGLILLASCDNIIPGVMLGAIRVDVPSIVITGGSMRLENIRAKKLCHLM